MENRPEDLSCRCYGCLLRLYPRQHRQAYGQQMAQLFRDQCRDAWNKAGAWGLVGVWLRTLPDLALSSIHEHLAELKGKKSMTEKLSEVARPTPTPVKTMLRVALPVFLLVFGLCAIITFLLPEAYSSTARIKLEPQIPLANGQPVGLRTTDSYDPYRTQTELGVIQSSAVLGNVVELMDLNTAWGRKYGGGNRLTTAAAVDILKSRLELRPVRNSTLVEIRVFSEDRHEAARIANAIADAYRELRLTQQRQVAAAGVEVLVARYQEQLRRIKQTQGELESLREALGLSASELNGAAFANTNMLHALETQLAEALALMAASRQVVTKLESLNKVQLRQVLPRVRLDPLLNESLVQLNKAELELRQLSIKFGANHPEYVRAKEQVDALNQKVDEGVAGSMAVAAQQLENAQARVAAMEKQIASLKRNDAEKQAMSRPYVEKQRELEQLQNFVRVLDTKIASEKIQATLPATGTVEVIDRAQPGLRPVRPNRYLNLFLGAVGGLGLGLLIGGAAVITRLLVARLRRNPTAA